jgi:LacI family transcriptional regulator
MRSVSCTFSFYHPIARTVQDVARTPDYDALIANSDHVYENEKHFCEAVMRRPVDGVIMAPQHLTYEEIDDLLTITNTPIAALGQHSTIRWLTSFMLTTKRERMKRTNG